MSGTRTRAPGQVPTLHIPIERSQLRCGATLLVSPRPGAPVAAIQLHVRGGASLDPAGLEGLAYLTSGTLDQGTAQRDEEALAELLEPAGGEVSSDASGLSGTIVNGEWKLLARLMAEMVTQPTFPSKKVALQKQRLLHRLEVERDDPRRQAALRFRKLVYGDHWLGRPASGTLETVSTITTRHMRAHHRRNWVAKRGLIAVCGDVDPQEVHRTLDRALRHWEPGEPLGPRKTTMPRPSVRLDSFHARRQQVHVYLGHLGIRRADPDYPALVVMDHVLGTGPGFTNRISRRLRDELGLAYTVSAAISSSAGRLPGVFNAYIGTSKQHVGTAIEGFRTEMRRIQDELVPEEELEVAKSYLVGSFALGFERAGRRAAYAISAEVHQFPPDNLETLPRAFAAITPEEVREAARKHLYPDRCCLCAAGPVTQRELERALRGS